MSKRGFVLFFALTVLIALGLMQKPVWPEALDAMYEPWVGFVLFFYLLAWLSPLLPLTAVMLRGLLRRPLSTSSAWSLATLAVAALPWALLIDAFMSDAIGTLAVVRCVLLTLAAASGFLVLAFGNLARCWVLAAYAGLGLAALAGAWSVVTVPAVIVQAERVANDAPYCLARDRRDAPVTSTWQLRGVSFHRVKWLYSRRTTHGLLIVATHDGKRVYEWSPYRFRFAPIQNDLKSKPVREETCRPIPGFVWTL